MFVLTSVSLFQCKPLHKPWCERRDAMQNIQDGGAKGCQRGCQEVWLVILKIASRNRMVAVKSSYDCSRKFVWLQSKVRMVAVKSSYDCGRKSETVPRLGWQTLVSDDNRDSGDKGKEVGWCHGVAFATVATYMMADGEGVGAGHKKNPAPFTDAGFPALQDGLEPTTPWLTVRCSNQLSYWSSVHHFWIASAKVQGFSQTSKHFSLFFSKTSKKNIFSLISCPNVPCYSYFCILWERYL